MFKYLPTDPNSARSIIKAGFRLYADSFKYSLALSISMSLILTIAFLFFSLYTQINDFLISFFVSITGLIFFIPLVKRIYSVGAGLPITTKHAYDGFLSHFIRITILICLLNYFSIFIIFVLSAASAHPTAMLLLAFTVVIGYTYFILKIYFANMFIILENKHIWAALKSSVSIEYHHMWLTFWVIFAFLTLFLIVVTFLSPYFTNSILSESLFNAVVSIIGIPMFIAIQITQFFNLKNLREK